MKHPWQTNIGGLQNGRLKPSKNPGWAKSRNDNIRISSVHLLHGSDPTTQLGPLERSGSGERRRRQHHVQIENSMADISRPVSSSEAIMTEKYLVQVWQNHCRGHGDASDAKQTPAPDGALKGWQVYAQHLHPHHKVMQRPAQRIWFFQHLLPMLPSPLASLA